MYGLSPYSREFTIDESSELTNRVARTNSQTGSNEKKYLYTAFNDETRLTYGIIS